MEILALYPISLTVTDSFNPQASYALARSSLGPNLTPVIALGSLLSLQALIVSSAERGILDTI